MKRKIAHKIAFLVVSRNEAENQATYCLTQWSELLDEANVRTDNIKNSGSKHSARERTGLIINLTFKTAATKSKRGTPKLKAEKHSATIVILMH